MFYQAVNEYRGVYTTEEATKNLKDFYLCGYILVYSKDPTKENWKESSELIRYLLRGWFLRRCQKCGLLQMYPPNHTHFLRGINCLMHERMSDPMCDGLLKSVDL